jgi:hypothetical protein
MTEACDPDADIENLRKTIKMQTGEDVKLTRKQMCEAYDNIHGGKLPLPPLVMTSDRTYLLDRASPLKHLDYELLFDSATKRSDLKRIARKIGLTSQIEQMTKKQLTDAIGKRLRYLKIREPVKIVSKRLITKDVSSTAVNNTAVNNTAVNNTAVRNNSAFNNTENRSSNFNNFGNKNNGNGNRMNNGNGNRMNNGNGNRMNNGSGNGNGNRVNLSGNKKGFTMTNNSGKAQNTLQFPSKLSFKSSFISKNTGNQQPAVQSIPKKVPTSKPSFLSQPQNTGPSAPTPSFSGGAKKNTSFLNKGTNAPSFGGSAKKNTSFLNKGTNTPSFSGGAKKNTSFLNKGTGTNVSAPSGPKKGMFNFMKGGAAAGAAGAVAVNASKKCGMFNRMMGRCKKNTGNAGNAGNTGNVNRTNNTGNAGNAGNAGNTGNVNRTNNTGNAGNTGNVNRTNNTGNAGNAGNVNRTNNTGNAGNTGNVNRTNNTGNTRNTGNVNRTNNTGNAGNTGNVNRTNNTGNTGNVNRDVNYVANNILTEISKDVKNGRLVNNVADDIVDEMLKKEIAGTIDKVANNKVANNKGPVNNKVANNKGPVKNVASEIMNQMLKKDITNSINRRVSRNMKNVDITDDVLKESVTDIGPGVNNKVSKKDVEIVADQILNQLMNNVKTKIRNTKPIYNSNSNSNNNANNVKINNPLFKPNMKNNPLFNSPKKNNNRKTESNQLSKYINNLGLKGNNKKKLMNLFNTTNQSLEAAKQNASTLSNTRKLQNSVVNEKNFNKERNTLQNKITKELNLRPNNNGVFRERKGLTKGRIGVWAQELRKAETIDDLKAIENTLNEKVELRKNIENKYTKMGLTNQSEKARHRNAVVKFKNNANARRKEIEEYLTKTPTLMNKGSYQSKVNRLQREFPKGTSPATRRNWMKKSRIYTGRIQKASQYGDMIKAYNNAMKSFKNLSK